ncbi:MAG: DUF47 domain-containing protein, partial [Fidelibacterota bacterium]
LKEIFILFDKKKFQEMEEKIKRIGDLESEADEMKKLIRERLPRRILMPIDKTDLLILLKDQEAIIDRIENVALMLNLEKRNLIPKHIIQQMMGLVDKSVEAIDSLHKAVAQLKILMESTFGHKEVKMVKKWINKVIEIEEEVDELGFNYLKILFATKDLSPLMVFYTTNITKTLTELSNLAENVAETLRLVIVKRTKK